MSGHGTLVQLEEDLPAVPAGQWLWVDEDGTVEVIETAEDVGARFDLDVIDEPESPPAAPDEAEIERRVSERVASIVSEMVATPGQAPVAAPLRTNSVRGKFGGLDARIARVLVTLDWAITHSGKGHVSSAEITALAPDMRTGLLHSGLYILRAAGLAAGIPNPGGADRVKLFYAITERGHALAQEIGDRPFIMAHVAPPWSRDRDQERDTGLTD